MNKSAIRDEIKKVINLEVEALSTLNTKLESEKNIIPYVELVEKIILCIENSGKVIVSGMGKAGKIAQKISATFSSTGTPSVYLHPSEALHGDLGLVQKGDVVLVLSNSGSTEDIVSLINSLKRMNVLIASIVGDVNSYLAKNSNIVLDASVNNEACPNNLAPTSSTLVSLAIGDSIAMAIQKERNFQEEDFAFFHPAGSLGRRLTLLVKDVMHSQNELPVCSPNDSLDKVLLTVTEKKMGGVIVCENSKMLGLITDGDIRRAILGQKEKIFSKLAADIMTKNPTSCAPDDKLIRALELMENRPSQISVLPVINQEGVAVGILRLHDLAKQS